MVGSFEGGKASDILEFEELTQALFGKRGPEPLDLERCLMVGDGVGSGLIKIIQVA